MSYKTIISSREKMIDLRKQLDITQTQLGDILGMSIRAIQDIEGGHAELRQVHQLALDRLATAYTVQLQVGGLVRIWRPAKPVAALNHLQAARLATGEANLRETTREAKDSVAKVTTVDADFRLVERWFAREK